MQNYDVCINFIRLQIDCADKGNSLRTLHLQYDELQSSVAEIERRANAAEYENKVYSDK